VVNAPDLFNLPELPYAGTSGHRGSDTSEARAKRDDRSGRTRDRQTDTLTCLARTQDLGLTWKELAHMMGWHHGQASGALSVLHKTERISRLTETRNRCKIYVLPEWEMARPTEPHGGSMKQRVGNPQEACMLTERQADILIDGQRVLVGQVARTLIGLDDTDPTLAAERVIATVADWLTQYRPADLGGEFIAPLDLTAFILRKGETLQ